MGHKKKISTKVLYYMFLLFPLVKPDVDAMTAYFGYMISEIVDDILVLWQFVSIGVSALTFVWFLINNKGKKKPKAFFVLGSALTLILTYSTIINSSMSLYRIIRELLPGFTFLLIANNSCDKEIKSIIRAFFYCLTIVMFINSLFIYFGNPWQVTSGNAVYYLYGLDNYTFMIVFCAFCAGAVLNVLEKGKVGIGLLILYLFIDGSYFYTNASTAIVVSVLCVFICCIYKTRLLKVVNWKTVLIALVGIFVVIVGSDFASRYFGSVFNVLGKLSNFSGRYHIWMIGFTAIQRKPFWGYGIDSGVINKLMVSSGLSWEVGHLHNVILEYLVKGGVVGFTVFAALWILSLFKTREVAYKNRYISSIIYCFFVISYLMYMFDYRIADYTSWIFVIFLSEMDVLLEYSSDAGNRVKNGWNKKYGIKKHRRKIR